MLRSRVTLNVKILRPLALMRTVARLIAYNDISALLSSRWNKCNKHITRRYIQRAYIKSRYSVFHSPTVYNILFIDRQEFHRLNLP